MNQQPSFKYITDKLVGKVLDKEYVIVTLLDDKEVHLVRMTGYNNVFGYGNSNLEYDSIDEFEHFIESSISPYVVSISSQNKYKYWVEENKKAIQADILVTSASALSGSMQDAHFTYKQKPYFLERLFFEDGTSDDFVYDIVDDHHIRNQELSYDEEFIEALLELTEIKQIELKKEIQKDVTILSYSIEDNELQDATFTYQGKPYYLERLVFGDGTSDNFVYDIKSDNHICNEELSYDGMFIPTIIDLITVKAKAEGK